MNRAGAVRMGIFAGAVLAVEAVCRLGYVKRSSLVPPTEMAAKLVAMVQQSGFWSQVWMSTRGVIIAFLASVVVGCMVAVVLHNLPRVRQALEPLIASYYAIPFFVLNPVLVVLFGMNATPIIIVGFLYGVMAMIVGTLGGLDRIPSVLRRTGRIHRLNGVRQALLISLPAAAPYVFTGIKLAIGYAVTGVIGSEFIVSAGGIGYSIAFAYNNFDDVTMYALLLFLMVAVSILSVVLDRVERSIQHRSSSAPAGAKHAEVTVRDKIVAGVTVAIVMLTGWQLLHMYVGDEALASPAVTGARIVALGKSELFWGHIAESGQALALALLVSCALGALLGVILGASPFASAVVEPMLVTIYALPKVTLYPVVLLFAGIGIGAKVIFGALYGMIPMMLIAMNGIRSMNPMLRRSARVMRLTRLQTFTTVLVPATVPELVTGIRVSFSITFLGVMIGELFASRRGLGFLIMNSINVNDTATMMAVIVILGVFALTINAALLAADKALHRV